MVKAILGTLLKVKDTNEVATVTSTSLMQKSKKNKWWVASHKRFS
jgi:hypothetical protein